MSKPSLLDLIKKVDNVPLDFEQNHDPFYCLLIHPDPRPHGYIHPRTISTLSWPSQFTIDDSSRTVTLSAASAKEVNEAFQAACDVAVDGGLFPSLNGLHSEPFRIPGARYDEIIHLERFTSSLFGICTRGSHMTAFVRGADALKIWVARRSKHLLTYPGMLDSTVAGGVKASDSPWDCIIAESDEEACLKKDLTENRVKSTGVITLVNRSPRTDLVHGEILYVYDLELQDGETPTPQDGEVDAFELLEWQDVVERMRAGEFKPNVCHVMIDFLIRHGLITSDTDPDYVEICTRLRRALPMPTSK
ncbi:hypothetical protein Golomagni_06648 [Golovinomyces magnicellulatus]|nr:hypothetical protein Golomagni_06648 [Golovinomyces magnicellulatus]